MDIRFAASQAVEIIVPDEPIHISNYLRQPQRVVNALAASSQIDPLSGDGYRLKMRPLNFMMLNIRPVVDMKVWADEKGTINLKSIDCDLQGIENINEHFLLDLEGELYPCQQHGSTFLKGQADLAVEVDLPPPLLFTPRSLLETAGNGLLLSVLSTIKQRLLQQLLMDYRNWSTAQLASGTHQPSPPIQVNPFTI